MPRPPKGPKAMHSAVRIRVTTQQRRQLKDAAKNGGFTVSEETRQFWIRQGWMTEEDERIPE